MSSEYAALQVVLVFFAGWVNRRQQDVIEYLVTENPGYGYSRIRGVLRNLGIDLGRNTIKRILLDHGIEPAPERGKKRTWKTFIQSHLGEIAEADFFTIEVLTLVGLIRFYVLFVIDIETRRVEVAGITSRPHEAWMRQIARNLSAEDGILAGKRFLHCDRDPPFSEGFRGIVQLAGVEVPKMPAKSPNLRPYAERFVRSIKEECLNHIIPLGETHRRRAIREYVSHYRIERPHQGLDNELIEPDETAGRVVGEIKCRERLGGLLCYYYREAA